MPEVELTLTTYPDSIPHRGGGRRLVNMYAEQAEGNARSQYSLRGAPGMKEFADVPAVVAGATNQECRGFTWFQDTLYAVIGSFFVSIAVDGAVAHDFTTSIAGTGTVKFAADGDELIIITNQSDYHFDGTALGQLTGQNIVDFSDAVFIDGRMVAVQASPTIKGRFSWTDTNDLDSITAANFANAESAPDGLSRILKVNRLLWLLGETTTEPWYSNPAATTAAEAFARHADGIEPYGIAATDSAVTVGQQGFFLAKSQGADVHFRMISGSGSTRISNNGIDDWLRTNTYSDAIGFGYEQAGHSFAGWAFPEADRCFFYDANLNFWHERQSGVDIEAGWDARQCIVAHDKVLVGGPDGKIYELDHDTHTDRGNSRMALFTAESGASGERWNTLNEIKLDITTGRAAAGTTVEPKVMLQLSGDGGKTYGREYWRDLGLSGDYSKIVKWHPGGLYSLGPLARFRITDAVPREVTKVFMSGVPGRAI